MGMEDGNQLHELTIENSLSLIPHCLGAGACRVSLYSAKTLSEDNVDFTREGWVEANECYSWAKKWTHFVLVQTFLSLSMLHKILSVRPFCSVSVRPLKLSEPALDCKSTVQQFPWITRPSSPVASSTPCCCFHLPGEDSLCRGDTSFTRGVWLSAALFCRVGWGSCLLPVKMILPLNCAWVLWREWPLAAQMLG